MHFSKKWNQRTWGYRDNQKVTPCMTCNAGESKHTNCHYSQHGAMRLHNGKSCSQTPQRANRTNRVCRPLYDSHASSRKTTPVSTYVNNLYPNLFYQHVPPRLLCSHLGPSSRDQHLSQDGNPMQVKHSLTSRTISNTTTSLRPPKCRYHLSISPNQDFSTPCQHAKLKLTFAPSWTTSDILNRLQLTIKVLWGMPTMQKVWHVQKRFKRIKTNL